MRIIQTEREYRLYLKKLDSGLSYLNMRGSLVQFQTAHYWSVAQTVEPADRSTYKQNEEKTMKKELTTKQKIEKMNRETGMENLRNASILKGNETQEELEKIYDKCLDINIVNIFNAISSK